MVTGYLNHETKFQLELLHEAANQNGLADYKKIIIKNHPDLPVDKFLETLRPRFQFTLTSQPLSELWPTSDVIYCSNSTAAAIEAGYLGIPVIITGAENWFNLNSLHGFLSVNYVTNSKMLCEELKIPTKINIPEDYFYLNNRMTLWKNLLQE